MQLPLLANSKQPNTTFLFRLTVNDTCWSTTIFLSLPPKGSVAFSFYLIFTGSLRQLFGLAKCKSLPISTSNIACISLWLWLTHPLFFSFSPSEPRESLCPFILSFCCAPLKCSSLLSRRLILLNKWLFEYLVIIFRGSPETIYFFFWDFLFFMLQKRCPFVS